LIELSFGQLLKAGSELFGRHAGSVEWLGFDESAPLRARATYWLSMNFSENRYPFFGIVL
jgi:hypothetical protein